MFDDGQDLRTEFQRNALALDMRLQGDGDLLLDRREDARGSLDQRDLAAERGEDLRHLDADRPGTDDDQALRRALDVEQLFAGDHLRQVDALDRQQMWHRSRGDDGIGECHLLGLSAI